jgi:PAS domain S-box-containing protein
MLWAIASLTYETGAMLSPFIATWMIATIFAGVFGLPTLLAIFAWVNIFAVITILSGEMTTQRLVATILATELPIIVSYILWHTKSSNDKNKERAYSDLANELNQVANKAEVVIGAISDGVLAVNNQGMIELINPAAQRIVGWGNQDALNLDYKSVLQMLGSNGHEIDKSSDPVFKVLTTNQPIHRNDIQLQTSSGKKISVDVVVSPIGRMGSGAIIVFRDVTKEQADGKAQTEFISTASHEMRTPVASIEGYLGLALNPATATIDEKAREFIQKAHESAQHLGRLFQDLLDVTKADDGRLTNNPRVIEIVAFTNEIVENLRPKADQKNLRLFFNQNAADSDVALRNVTPVYFADLDADHLREVLSNLVENAIKYTPKGEVIIEVKGDDSHIIVSIRDSGIGIPAEDIPHLFQKFYRVDNSDTREIGGTGLGLYLCRRLIESMGGRIWVDSEYKKGSTFSVELPRISHEEANRLIEASEGSIQPIAQKQYLDDNQPESSANGSQEQPSVTPIILNHSAPVRESKTAFTDEQMADNTSADTPEMQSTDPLVGSGTNDTSHSEPLRPHNGIVLPPAMQKVEPVVQLAKEYNGPTSENQRSLNIPGR